MSAPLKLAGIYCIENIETKEKFINSTKNINTYKNNIVNKLNNNKHTNRRLQAAWNLHTEKAFKFNILEIVENLDELTNKKQYWINTYKSNEIGLGYNVELTKKASEQKREEWLKNKSWGISDSIQDLIQPILNELDYSLEFSIDRKEHLIKILEKVGIDWLIDYMSSPLFRDKQIKTRRDFLAENDLSLMGLNYIVDYLVFPKYKNQEEKEQKVDEKNQIRKRKSEANMDYRRGGELLFGDLGAVENKVLNSYEKNPNVKKSKKQQIFKVKENHEITKHDINKFSEIESVYNVLLYLRETLGYEKNEKEKKIAQELFVQKYGKKQLNIAKKLYRDLSSEILEMKELLTGTIRFNNITRGTTVFNYDMDTGYFNENDEYVLVSENKISFSDPNHILQLLNFYSQLKQSQYDKPFEDMSLILLTLDDLIEKTDFEQYLKEILIMKIDQYEATAIIDKVKEKYGIELSEDKLSRIYNEVIPKMIVNTYIQDKMDWIYTYKIKGNYKTCSKCKEIKLATNDFFSFNKSSKDGLNSICKKCRS